MRMTSIKNQKGGIILFVFAAITVISYLTYLLSSSNGLNEERIKIQKIANLVVMQSNIIRNGLTLCSISYPQGGVTGGTDSAYPATTTSLSSVACPGKSDSLIFGELSSVSYPRQVDGMGGWELVNDATGVFIKITPSNLSLVDSLSIALDKLGSNQASMSANTLSVYVKK